MVGVWNSIQPTTGYPLASKYSCSSQTQNTFTISQVSPKYQTITAPNLIKSHPFKNPKPYHLIYLNLVGLGV